MTKQRESEMRPAEEVARDLVSSVQKNGIGFYEFWVRDPSTNDAHAIVFEDYSIEDAAEDDAENLRTIIAAAITRAREEGAAAERARQQPADVALCPAPDVPGQWIAHHVTRDLVTQGDSEPHALRMLAEAIEMMDGTHAQPRDLAGRIRALVCEYAGRWADSDDAAQDEALHDVMDRLVYIASSVRRGMPIGMGIDWVRSDAASVAWGAALVEAADRIDAITRECEETKR